MSKLIDITGQRFGRLLVVSQAKSNNGQTKWHCVCDCGNHTISRSQDLRLGKTVSCGCWGREQTANRNRKHGMYGTRPCRIWRGMHARCYNPRELCYSNYGGRGITICERWKNNFSAFWEDMQDGYADDLEIDRIDNNGNYCPENCRWVTRSIQARNQRRIQLYPTPWGEICLTEIAEKSGIPYTTLKRRVRDGWSIDKLLQPLKGKGGAT